MNDNERGVPIAELQTSLDDLAVEDGCCKEALVAGHQTLALTPAEQVAFWNDLVQPVPPTDAQKALGKFMRGE